MGFKSFTDINFNLSDIYEDYLKEDFSFSKSEKEVIKNMFSNKQDTLEGEIYILFKLRLFMDYAEENNTKIFDKINENIYEEIDMGIRIIEEAPKIIRKITSLDELMGDDNDTNDDINLEPNYDDFMIDSETFKEWNETLNKYIKWYNSMLHIPIPEFTPKGWNYKKTYICLFLLFLKLWLDVNTFFCKSEYELNMKLDDKEPLLNKDEIFNKFYNNIDDNNINNTEEDLFSNKYFWNIEEKLFFKNIFIFNPFVSNSSIEIFQDLLQYYLNNFKDTKTKWFSYNEQKISFLNLFLTSYYLTLDTEFYPHWEEIYQSIFQKEEWFIPKQKEYFFNRDFSFYFTILCLYEEWYINIKLVNQYVNEQRQKKIIDPYFSNDEIEIDYGIESIFYWRLNFYIQAENKLIEIWNNFSKWLWFFINKLLDDEYDTVSIVKEKWVPKKFEWWLDVKWIENVSRIKKKYKFSYLTTKIHDSRIDKYRIINSIKFK
jgi:hypothetical protein